VFVTFRLEGTTPIPVVFFPHFVLFRPVSPWKWKKSASFSTSRNVGRAAKCSRFPFQQVAPPNPLSSACEMIFLWVFPFLGGDAFLWAAVFGADLG